MASRIMSLRGVNGPRRPLAALCRSYAPRRGLTVTNGAHPTAANQRPGRHGPTGPAPGAGPVVYSSPRAGVMTAWPAALAARGFSTARLEDDKAAAPAAAGAGKPTGSTAPQQPQETRRSRRRREQRREVVCSWPRPGRTVRLLFESLEPARAAYDRLTLGGDTTTTDLPVKTANPPDWFVVNMTGVPASTTEADIVGQLPEDCRPDRVEMGALVDSDEISDKVRAILAASGPLDKWQYPVPAARRVKARARFVDEADARKAADLDGANLKIGQGKARVRIAVAPLTTITYRIPVKLWKVILDQTTQANINWRQNYVHFRARPHDTQWMVLTLESEHDEATVKAAEELEKMINGELILGMNAKPSWDPVLMFNDHWFERVKGLEEYYGVFIVRSRTNAQLHISGPADKCKPAKRALRRILADAHKQKLAAEEKKAADEAASRQPEAVEP